MQYDLKMIKKYYGEDMMHFCRNNFSTLLEKEGQILNLIESNFAHTKFLYEDLEYEELLDDFKDFIYGLTREKKEPIETNKSVKELLDEAGYILYECRTEEDVQKFKKYYVKGEELCTFNGGRLNSCYVFFAVKKNVKEIKRENFNNPNRQDKYGTSVISIQFTKGENNTLSIKNRYNHTVSGPDATFRNNLENIIPGLTKAFEKEYGFNVNQNINGLKSDFLVLAGDGKYYPCLLELENTYYGPENYIIDNFRLESCLLDKSRYLVIGILILDMHEKKLYKYDPTCNETLPYHTGKIKKIIINNSKTNKHKTICIINENNEDSYITIDCRNQIVGYVNNHIKAISDDFFLYSAHYIRYFEARNLEKVGNGFLNGGVEVEEFIAPNLKVVGNGFLGFNKKCKNLDCPNIEKRGFNFMWNHPIYKVKNTDKSVTSKAKVKVLKN